MRYGWGVWIGLVLAMGWSSHAVATNPGAVGTSDIDHFWQAYDRIRAEPDSVRQRELLQQLFLDRGSEGLRAFMQAKGYDADCYLQAIRDWPLYWESMRPRMLALKARADAFAPEIARFRALYPALRPASIHFTVGCLRSSGTTLDDKVLIGAELAAGDAGVVLDELPDRLRKGLGVYFASRPAEQLALLGVHEYVHTQTQGPGATLLAQAMYEGVADFVAEQVTGRLPDLPYVAYGRANEDRLRQEFAEAMHEAAWSGWLYNGPGNPHGVGDLGYYIGYAIMRDHHAHAADKRVALAQMLELDYRDQAAVERFAAASGFFDGVPLQPSR